MNPLSVCILLLAASASALGAQVRTVADASYDHDRDAPVATGVRVSEPIRVDGVLEESAWTAAPAATEFTQLDPEEGASATQRTEVRIVYDDGALYIGARLIDAHPPTTRLGRRDMSMDASDWLTVILDSYHDHRTAYGFEVNPSGVRRDQTRAGNREDDSWDPVWQAATEVTDSGWVAELRIPFSQLRFSGAPEQTWGMQIQRTRARNQEFSVWSFTPRDETGGIPRYGHLSGLEEIPTGKRLEVLPYTVTRAEYVDRSGNPFRSDREYAWDAGVDLKYRVTSNLTLDATINPDFGQVEVDPAVVNLSAFETFFPEKRPFFIEGAEIFRFGRGGGNEMFYSRRIGRRPSLAPPHASRDVPDVTRILGAAKLSGRTANGWSIGVLDATTGRETARFRTPDGVVDEVVAEPLTNYFVGRARREMRDGRSAVGGFFSSVHRRLSTDRLAGALRSTAYSGGLDLSHEWDDRTWSLSGFLSGSFVRGEPATIAAAQRAPYHYFQRPDAGHLDYDTLRTGLAGISGELALSKRVGRHWRGRASVGTISPGYEVSDLGFQRRADRIDARTNLSYSETRPGDLFRRYSLFSSYLVEHNYGGDMISNRVFAGAFFQFLNYWNGSVSISLMLPGTVDDRLTRGGPAARRPGTRSVFTRLATDDREPIVLGGGASFRKGEAGGRSVRVYGDLEIKPAPNWELTLSPSFGRTHEPAQYLRSVRDPLASSTFGTRYVFAELDRTTLALETRFDYTVSPGLSLQAYVQPFIATGTFGPPKEFAAPGTFDFLTYGRDIGEVVDGTVYPDGRYDGAPSFAAPSADFNLRSLRGNAVLRWEWRPGSTLYVAWQQTRRGARPFGDFDLGRDAGAIFSAPPDDVFLVKMSYWLNP